jgi:hypothetical protein
LVRTGAAMFVPWRETVLNCCTLGANWYYVVKRTALPRTAIDTKRGRWRR